MNKKENKWIDISELDKPIKLKKAPQDPGIYLWLMIFITVCGFLFLKIMELLR